MSTTRTDSLRAGAVLEARMAAAYRDGHDTVRGRQPRVNPWDGRSEDPTTRTLSMMWARGYTAGTRL